MYFFYQLRGKESEWKMAFLNQKEGIINRERPAFTTVLAVNKVPDNNDWTSARYCGPFYADFDAEGDIEFVCEQLQSFIGKLDLELKFDMTQARYYATGGKGFHVEIPEACFMEKPAKDGTPWLPYIYREVAQTLMVDTLDLNVYTGKRGRQWRTTNVKRENGNYKVPISFEEAISMTPELYAALVAEPRAEADFEPTPPSCNPAFSLRFTLARDKVLQVMRGKKRRQEQSNKVLDPWRKAKKTPPSIEGLMSGGNVAGTAGFQALAMQLAIYATSVGMARDEFIERCRGLCENHDSDSYRYNTPDRRRQELSRMWEYMGENSLYDFDVGPIVALLADRSVAEDLGVIEAPPQPLDENGTPKPADKNASIRRGVMTTPQGLFAATKDGDRVSICRATFEEPEAFFEAEHSRYSTESQFRGYECDLVVEGKPSRRVSLTPEVLTSAQNMRKFLSTQMLAYQGSESDTAAVMDMISQAVEGSARKTYVYPREGIFVLNHPDRPDTPTPVTVYLTKNNFVSSLDERHPDFFSLKYRPGQAVSTYNIDIHNAPQLGPQHVDTLRKLFKVNKPEVVASLLGWFASAHAKGVYLHKHKQFPNLHIFGLAGAGKTKTVELFSHMHWNSTENISVKSALACKPFALDSLVSTSTSAPLILDEYKPRELMKAGGGKYEKVKDVLKNSYNAADVGERGSVNKIEGNISVLRSKATAPIVFLGESMEVETAIIERSVVVPMAPTSKTPERRDAFKAAWKDTAAISALGNEIARQVINMSTEEFFAPHAELWEIISEQAQVACDESGGPFPDRPVFNQSVQAHGIWMVRVAVHRLLGDVLDEELDHLLKLSLAWGEETANRIKASTMSEASKVLSRMALNSYNSDRDYSMVRNKHYIVEDGYVEVNMVSAFDNYRLYCAATRELALYETLDSFLLGMTDHPVLLDKQCADSPLRQGSSSEAIYRFSIARMRQLQINTFKD